MTRSIAACLTMALLVPLMVGTRVGAGEKDQPQKTPPAELNAKGRITLTTHKMTMTKGIPHQIAVRAKNFSPRVTIVGAFLSANLDFSKPHDYNATFTPSQTKEYTILVLPDPFGPAPEAKALEYTLTIKPVKLAEKPILKVADKLTEQDMKVEGKNTYYKSYPIKLKAGQTYVIDHVHPEDSRIDPFLYLKEGNRIVTQDDDSGGNLNARIIFTPTKDGEFTIIATTLSPSTGDFVLTVRGPAEEKTK